MLWFLAVSLAYAVLIYKFYGFAGLACFLCQAAVAICLLEEINAIEHYGLERQKGPDGTYERVGPQHSWDAPHSILNYLLFKLQ